MRVVAKIPGGLELCMIEPHSPHDTSQAGRQYFNEDMKHSDPKGFAVQLNPVYDTDVDPRLKENPTLKERVEKWLSTHPSLRDGRYGFYLYTAPKTVLIDRSIIEEKDARIAKLEKMLAEKPEAGEKANRGRA